MELLRRGEHSDVNPPWFFTVGTSLLLTMCINLVVPHAWPAIQCVPECEPRCVLPAPTHAAAAAHAPAAVFYVTCMVGPSLHRRHRRSGCS